jgi:hypothetical protein
MLYIPTLERQKDQLDCVMQDYLRRRQEFADWYYKCVADATREWQNTVNAIQAS